MVGEAGRVRWAVRAFLSWWFDELTAIVPSRLKRVLAIRRDRLVFSVSDTAVDLFLVRHGDVVERESIPLAGSDDQSIADCIGQLAASGRPERRAIELTVPADCVMQKSLYLPAAAEDDLRQLLKFEMDRLTPFRAEDLYFDYVIGERDARAKRIRVDIAVAQRRVVDRALELARGWGLDPARVSVRMPDPVERSPWQLVRQSTGRRAAPIERVPTLVFAGLGVILLGGLVYVPLHQKSEAVEALSRDIAIARDEAVRGADLQSAVSALTEQSRFLMELKAERPPFVAVLNELTRVVPDETWLFRLQYRNGAVQAYGYSDAAAGLIGKIEASPIFEDPLFRAPVMRDERAEAERFHITFRVAGGEIGLQ